jgi:hypothetical protein
MLEQATSSTRRFRMNHERNRADAPTATPGSPHTRIVVFTVMVGLVLAYALRGGAYDIVVRQEYAIGVWFVLGVGFAFGVIPRARAGRITLVFIAALAAYAAWSALSLTWTESSERTIAEVARAVGYIGLVGLIASLVDRVSWRAAAGGIAFGALLVCSVAVASRLIPDVFPAAAQPGATFSNRLSYPFGYWNAVGAWGAMSSAIGLAWSAHDRSRFRRAFALGLVPVALLTTYLSYSRAGVAGTALGLVVVLTFSRARLTALIHAGAAAVAAAIAILAVRHAPPIADGTGTAGAGTVAAALAVAVAIAAVAGALAGPIAAQPSPRLHRLLRLTAIAGALCVVGLAIAFGPGLISRGWRQFTHPVIATTADPASRLTQLSGTRYQVWRGALDAFQSRPLTGRGAGTFEFWWDRHPRTDIFVRNAHSFELESMAELGLPGLVLIVAVMASGLTVLVRVRRRVQRSARVGASVALAAAFAVNLLHASVDWMWQVTAVTMLALAAVAIGGARLAVSVRGTRWYTRTAVVILAAGAIVLELPGLLSTTEVRRSQAAERAENASLALAWAAAAVGAEPWGASPYEQRALVLESVGELDRAATDEHRAISREPYNFRHWLLLARMETERGDLTAAVVDYNRARQLDPYGLVFEYAPRANTPPSR